MTDQDRADFAAFCVDVADRYPLVHDFIVGNEPNLNRFWLPQFGPNGEDVAAPAYEQLLAVTYDALKAVRPHSTIYGGSLAPRGVDKPGTGRDTHSPTAFITDLGAAYRASGRQVPIMDAFAFHPYPESSSTGPNFAHPNSTSIGLADYGKLVALLGTAFDGTAQHGSSLPILYDEFGIETTVPVRRRRSTPAPSRHDAPVDEATQAQMYTEAMQMVFCQKTVMGLFLFHVQDEAALAAWQSGEYYVDGTAEVVAPSRRCSRRDRAPGRRRVVPGAAADAEARCPGFEAGEDGHQSHPYMLTRLLLHRRARPAPPHRHRRRSRRDHARLQGRASAWTARRLRPGDRGHERGSARVGPAVVLLALTAVLAACGGHGRELTVGAVDDAAKWAPDAKRPMRLAQQAGLRAVVLSAVWKTGASAAATCRRCGAPWRRRRPWGRPAARRLPAQLLDAARRRSTERVRRLRGALVRALPAVRTVFVGNEPNLNLFWEPQFDPSGGDAAADAYEQLLAVT